MSRVLHTLKERILSPVPIISWAAASVLSAAIGPFNTYAVLPFTERLLFWTGIIAFSIVLIIFINVIIRTTLPKLSHWQQSGLSVAVFLPTCWAFVISVINILDWGMEIPPYSLILIIIASVTLTVMTIIYLVSPDFLTGPLPAPENAGAPKDSGQPGEPDLSPLLGTANGHELIRLAMHDHYVEVVSDKGQNLVLMRFSDALEIVDALHGGQTHRSHWVNYNKIRGVVKDKGKLGFRMSDDAFVPIARSRKPDLKKQGLL